MWKSSFGGQETFMDNKKFRELKVGQSCFHFIMCIIASPEFLRKFTFFDPHMTETTVKQKKKKNCKLILTFIIPFEVMPVTIARYRCRMIVYCYRIQPTLSVISTVWYGLTRGISLTQCHTLTDRINWGDDPCVWWHIHRPAMKPHWGVLWRGGCVIKQNVLLY